MFLNAQSVRNKALDICDYMMQANVDLVFLYERSPWDNRTGWLGVKH